MANESQHGKYSKEDILQKITALAKGFLLTKDESPEKTCSFCRGLLILLNQFHTIKANDT